MGNIRASLVVSVLFVVTIFGIYGSVYAEQSNADKQQLGSLKQGLSDLSAKLAALQPVYASLVEEKKRLSDVGELLKGATVHHKKNVADITRQFSMYDAAVKDHNSRCEGTFEDRKYVDGCNAAAAQYRKWRQDLTEEAIVADKMEEGLAARQESLSQATLDWAQKIKSYDAKRDDLITKRDSLLMRTNNVLEDLKRRGKISIPCPDMTSVEAAKICIDKVWSEVR